jgi:transposase
MHSHTSKVRLPSPHQNATRNNVNILTIYNMPPQRSFGTEISGNRLSNRELSIDARNSIISKCEAGASTRELAAEFGVTSQTIRNTLRRYSKTGSNASRPRSGRPPILSTRESRTLYRHARKAPKITYNSLIKKAHLQKDYSHSTAYRALRNQSLTNFRAPRQPMITASNAQKRLRFCREYTDFNWRRVTFRFSDECSVEKDSGQNTEWVFRFADEKWKPRMITERSTSRGPQQIVWACIYIDSKGRTQRSPLVIMQRDANAARNGYTADSYIEALEEDLLPSYRPGERFIMNNARVHTARRTTEFLESHGIWTIDFPPYSPDLNPIEHLWWALK